MSNQTNDIQLTIDSVKEFSDLKEVRSTIEELHELKKESEQLAKEIESRKSKLMELYAQKKADKRDEFKDKATELCNILSESLYDSDSENRVGMIVFAESDYHQISIFSQVLGVTLSVLYLDEDDIEVLQRWINLQIESIAFYRLLLNHFGKDLINASYQQLVGHQINDLEWLEFKYQTDTDSVVIIHRSLLTADTILDMISNAYRDGRKFKRDSFYDEDNIVLTSSKETICNVADFVETVEKIELSSK